MSSLTGQVVYTLYGDLLTTTNLGQGLSLNLEPLQDGLGQSSTIQIALNAVNFSRAGGNTFQLDSINLTASATDINAVAAPNPILPGMGGVTVPGGTTAQRDPSPKNGEIRYNTDTHALEAYQNGVWGNLQSGAVIGPGVSVTNDIATFADTTGLVLKDSGVNITAVAPPLAALGHSSLLMDVQISGVDILNFGSSLSNDVGVIYRQTDYVLGIFPNTIVNKFPNIVLGFANPASTDAAFQLTDGALLLSRLTQTQINALIPIDGMLVYNTTTEAFNFYQNGVWADLATGAVLTVNGTANEIVTTGTTSVTVSIAPNPVLPGTASVLIPFGGTADRPGTPLNGDFRYNTDSNVFEGYQGGSWVPFGSGGGSVTSITAGSNLTGGTITTSGTIALSNTVTGLTSLDANALSCLDINILATGGVPGFINLYNAANSHFVSFTAPATILSNVTWTLPGTDGSSGQALTTNGAGTLTWTTTGNNTATYILQTPDATLPNSQALSDLGSAGLLKINASGVVQLAVADVDYATEATLVAQVAIAEAAAVAASADAALAASSATAAGVSATAAAASAITAAMEAGAITGSTSATFILQIPNSNLPNAQALSSLSSGLLKNTTLGVVAIATPGTDYYSAGHPTTILDTGLAGNFFIGTTAGNGTLTGVDNVGVGYHSAFALTTGNRNTTVGYQSGQALTSANDTVLIGYQAGNALTSGSSNTLVGTQAGALLTSAGDNCIFGYQAADEITSANNCIFGFQAAGAATSASQLSVFGASAGFSITTGGFNSFFGYEAGLLTTTGNNNCCFGWQAGAGTDTSSGICAFGSMTFLSAISSPNCCAFGDSAASTQNNYTNCTFLGAGADASNDGLTNATAIGYNAQVGVSNALVLGNGANVGIGTSSPTQALTVIGGQVGNLTESATSYTVLNTDYIIGITNTSSARTVTLPTAAAGNKGQEYTIKDESGGAATHNITVSVTGGANIDGAASAVINTNYGVLRVYSNGTQWYTR